VVLQKRRTVEEHRNRSEASGPTISVSILQKSSSAEREGRKEEICKTNEEEERK